MKRKGGFIEIVEQQSPASAPASSEQEKPVKSVKLLPAPVDDGKTAWLEVLVLALLDIIDASETMSSRTITRPCPDGKTYIAVETDNGAGAEIEIASDEVEENTVNGVKVEEVPFFPQYLRAFEIECKEPLPPWALVRAVYLVSEEQARGLLNEILHTDADQLMTSDCSC